MRKAAKVRIYPTTEQKQLLAKQFGCARFWWNKALGWQYEHRSNNGKWLKRTELNAMLPKLKKELPWLKTDCYSQVLQSVTKNLEQAMKNWFEGRAKKPRFKAKKNKQSISFPQNVIIVGDCLKVPAQSRWRESKEIILNRIELLSRSCFSLSIIILNLRKIQEGKWSTRISSRQVVANYLVF